MNRLGIYIHWPYCISKCPYCDFNSHKIKNYDQNELMYKDEIHLSGYGAMRLSNTFETFIRSK